MVVPSDASRYAGEFLSEGVGARALGIGKGFVAISNDVSALYWNPSGLVHLNRGEAMVMHTERFGGVVNYDFAGVGLPLQDQMGIGIGLIRSGVDGIKYTVLENPREAVSSSNRPRVLKMVGNVDYAVFLSMGRVVRRRFDLGGSVKLIRRTIGDDRAFGYGIDIGVLYTPLSRISLGAVLRDAVSTRIAWENGTKDVITPSVLLGVSYTSSLPYIGGDVSFSAGTETGEDRDRNLSVGVEYRYQRQVAVRLGSEERNLTAGGGFSLYDRVSVDVAFLDHPDLDNTYRVSASVKF
jgi:hypothetical protein